MSGQTGHYVKCLILVDLIITRLVVSVMALVVVILSVPVSHHALHGDCGWDPLNGASSPLGATFEISVSLTGSPTPGCSERLFGEHVRHGWICCWQDCVKKSPSLDGSQIRFEINFTLCLVPKMFYINTVPCTCAMCCLSI